MSNCATHLSCPPSTIVKVSFPLQDLQFSSLLGKGIRKFTGVILTGVVMTALGMMGLVTMKTFITAVWYTETRSRRDWIRRYASSIFRELTSYSYDALYSIHVGEFNIVRDKV